MATCKQCGGTGIILRRPECVQERCPACNGSGIRTAYARGLGKHANNESTSTQQEASDTQDRNQ